MATAKSFSELGDIYTTQVLTEAAKQTVGGKLDIGKVELTKEGGDEKVKKDLETPTEKKSEDGAPTDGEKEISAPKKKAITESNMKKSFFDQVYSQIVSEDAQDGDGDATNAPLQEDDGLGEEVPAIPGDEPAAEEETIDPVAVIGEIDALLCKLKKHFGVECGEPEVDEVDVVAEPTDEPAVGEAVDAKKLPDAKGKSLQGAKKSADTGGTKVVKKKASAEATTGDGKLEKAPDGEKLAGDKKAGTVKGDGPAVKGGDKSALE